MKINSENDFNHANSELPKIDVSSEIFSPDSSSSESLIYKGKIDFNFLFNSQEIIFFPKNENEDIYEDEEEVQILSKTVSIINESIQITIDEKYYNDNECDEILNILKKKNVYSTKNKRHIPVCFTMNKPKEMSLAGRIWVNNTQKSIMASTQNTIQISSLVSCSKK